MVDGSAALNGDGVRLADPVPPDRSAAEARPTAEALPVGPACPPSSEVALELQLKPGSAARLSRHKALAGARWRSAPQLVTWHDSGDGALAARGLALQREGSSWQMLRLADDRTQALPGAPARVLGEADDPAALGLPTGLPPLAHFEGVVRTRMHMASATTLTLLEGTLRTVARDAPCCRLILRGPAVSVVALAQALAGAFDLALAPAPLAAEAIALARDVAVPPRRLGAPALAADMSVSDAMACVLGHLTDVLLHWAPRVGASSDAEATDAVHQMRVALRRLRSALSLFGPALACPTLDALKPELRHAAGQLGPARDWDVFVTETGATITAALPDDAALAALMQAADAQRRAHRAVLRHYLASPAWHRVTVALAAAALGRPWDREIGAGHADGTATRHRPLAAFGATILRDRTRKLLKRRADLGLMPMAELHAIRLKAKRLRYATEFFAPLFPGHATGRFRRRLAGLQERLGHLNDGAVAGALMAELAETTGGEARGVVRGFVAAKAAEARPRLASSWRKLRKFKNMPGLSASASMT